MPGWGIYNGQNLAWGFWSWDAAIQAWYDEVKDFKFGQGSINGKPVGHYTQVRELILLALRIQTSKGLNFFIYIIILNKDKKLPVTLRRSQNIINLL